MGKGEGGEGGPVVTKGVARAGVTITLASKVLEEEGEVSPLRTRRIMILPMTTGIYTGKVKIPHVVLSTTLNTKPIGTLFSIQMGIHHVFRSSCPCRYDGVARKMSG
jgi:hypothetical protein